MVIGSMELVWGFLTLLFMFLEVLTPGTLVSLWFALGALVTTLVSIFVEDLYIQIIVFLSVSIISMLLFRKYCLKLLSSANKSLNTLEGANVVLTEAEGNEGKAKINDVKWNVYSKEELEVGVTYKVLKVEGNKLLVGKDN